MLVHLLVDHESAEKLYPRALKNAARVGGREIKDVGRVVEETLDEHFDKYGSIYLHDFACLMKVETDGLYSLQYDHYLPETPRNLLHEDVTVVGAEIIRRNSAITKARAGFYRWEGRNATATVEHVFPWQQYPARPTVAYVHNIHVKATTLPDAIAFNTKLSMGHFNRFLVDAWG